MPFEIAKGENFADAMSTPRRWCRTLRVAGQKREHIVYVTCPLCSGPMTLTAYVIETDGTVRPCLVCPYEPCRFREYVKLTDWTP